MTDRSLDTVQQLLAAGRVHQAVQLLTHHVAAGDAAAQYQMALWHLIGSPLPRDLPKARALLARAREARHGDAAMFEIALTANGSGGTPDWRAAQALLERAAGWLPEASAHRALLAAMAIGPDGMPTTTPVGEPFHQGADVHYFANFVTEQECAHIATGVTDILRPAPVVDPATGRAVLNPVRTSDAAVVGPTREDLVVRAINLRIAAASATDAAQGEALTVLRYAPGQEFRLHSDAIAGARNQRIATMLLYLNDDFVGGETVFPDLGLTIRPKRCDALLFGNVDADGRVDQRMRHAGTPVRSGMKWLATRWIRARRFSPWYGPDQPI
ncbi:2OG-Fe(II) oxygenase [Sphingomonas sp. Leaf22]|uniref:2OG-Fe(II) oxygenase n=1 Tax=Sphingomonas sp. Leaf22 TaxID=1735687 RepID=UPI000AA8E1A3|nr:2OG-Fe(II) oxygenase [Sphingomonas sp. Leaf22]